MNLTVNDFQLPDISDSLVKEIDDIGAEFLGGRLYSARALARAARLIIEEKYQGIEIPDEVDGGTVIFVHQEDILAYLHKMFGMSIATMKSHLTRYRRLVNGAKLPWSSALKAVVNCPGSLDNLPDIASFDVKGNITDVNTQKVLSLPTVNRDDLKEAIDADDKESVLDISGRAIGDFVDEAANLENARESAKLFAETLGKNTLHFRFESDGSFVAVYAERALGEDGLSELVGSGEIVFVPQAKPPQWVLEKITRRLSR